MTIGRRQVKTMTRWHIIKPHEVHRKVTRSHALKTAEYQKGQFELHALGITKYYMIE